MIIYCEFLTKNHLSDCDEQGDKADYQILYSNFGIGKEQFSMNYLNKLTGKHQYVKENSRIWKKGLEHARYSWNRNKELVKQLNSEMKSMKSRV